MIITNEPSFTFDGVYMKNMGYFLESANIGSVELNHVTQSIPKKVGNLNGGNEIGARTITLSIAIFADSQEDFNEKRLYLENLIIQSEASEKSLALDILPNWEFFGSFGQIGDFELINGYDYKTNIPFICDDPMKYGEQIEIPIVDGMLDITPKGQQATYPVFRGIAKKDVTWCGVTTANQFVYVGGKIDVETGETATTIYTPILKDTAQNMALWQRQSNETFTQVDNGTVGKGSDFQQATDDINVKTFGENTGAKNKWYGPALKRMMTKQLENWKVEFRIQSMNLYKRAENKLELYLVNSEGDVIGKLGIKDAGSGSEQEINVQVYEETGTIRTVGHFKPTVRSKKTVALNKKQKVKKTDAKGKVTYTYVTLKESIVENNSNNDLTDFYGYISLEKVGAKFFAKVVKMDTKTRNEINSWESVWTDTRNVFTSKLAGFVLYAGKMDIVEDTKGLSYKPNYLCMADLKCYERADIISEEIISSTPEIIIWEGDEIIIDCEKARVYQNGKKFMDALHIGSDFIELIGGVREQIVFSDDFDWSMIYRPTAY